MADYGMTIVLAGSMEEVRARVQAARKTQGLGILTGIDVHKTLKEKIGAGFEP